MKEALLDALLDALKILPFLFITFLIIELLEHRINSEKIIKKVGKFGPLVGSLLGAFPECGFSVSATNFYITRIISLGTLIAVYLSTSDEMLPIMISSGVNTLTILKIVGLKVLIGIICGFLIDLIYRKRPKVDINNLCEHDHCHCEDGILLSSLKHTINTFTFIFAITIILNISLFYFKDSLVNNVFFNNKFLGPLVTSLIGLIPNCGASIMITELYLNNTINFASMLSGLLTGCGVGVLVLFKDNENLKENITILALIYFIGVITGILINIIGMI